VNSDYQPAAVLGAIRKLDGWLQANAYQGYEPFDGLAGWLRPLAFGKLGRQLVVQFFKRCSWPVRPLFGIYPATSTKAVGYFARAFLKLYQATKQESYRHRAADCLRWLKNSSSPGYSGLCWGNHFDYQTRLYYLPKGGPTVVWTALSGHAFLDMHSLTKEADCLRAVESIGRFILHDLERRPQRGGTCISYNPAGYYPVHNANMLAAGFLSRAHRATGNQEYLEVSRQAAAYTLNCQQPDGSWWYGESENTRWVDNWHTAYVLDSLWFYYEASGDAVAAEAFRRGCAFWVKNFFLADGRPTFYAGAEYPVDIQAAAQGIETLCSLSAVYDKACGELARRVALWTISNMQHEDEHFCYRITKRGRNSTPMLHWGQATMLHALSCVLLQEKGKAV